ncbi:MAG: transposase [Kiritimatiellia bacterium]
MSYERRPTSVENELLRAALKRKDARIAQLEESHRLLEQRLNQVLRMLYGRKSEKIQDGQLELALGMAAPAPVIPEDSTPRRFPRPNSRSAARAPGDSG